MSRTRAVLLMGIALAGAGLGGCQEVFGGNDHDVVVATDPPGGTVWVVPYNQYLSTGVGDAFASGVDPSSKWLLTSGAPATFTGQAYSKMALGKLVKDGRVLRGVTPRPFTPGKETSVTVRLEAK